MRWSSQSFAGRSLSVSQLALFDDEAMGPEGLRYAPEFISAADEQELIAGIAALPLMPFEFGAFEGHRRVKSFGFRYDYALQKLQPSEPIPEWLERTAREVERFGELRPGSVRQVLCTEYDVGVGIGWHRDKPHFDKVFGISLGSACRFRRRYDDKMGALCAASGAALDLSDGRRGAQELGAQHPPRSSSSAIRSPSAQREADARRGGFSGLDQRFNVTAAAAPCPCAWRHDRSCRS